MKVILGIFIGIVLMGLLVVCEENESLNYEIKVKKAADKWKKIKEDKQKEYDLNEYENKQQKELDKNAIIIAKLVSEELENIL